MPPADCGDEHQGHVCGLSEGHRTWHKDTREWSATKGGAMYEWKYTKPRQHSAPGHHPDVTEGTALHDHPEGDD